MKRKSIIIIALISSFVATGCFNSKEKSTPDAIEAELDKISEIVSYKKLKTSKYYKSVYKIEFRQYIDHEDHSLGTFTQSLEFGYNALTCPTVLVTEGYYDAGHHYRYTNDEAELAYLLNCNYLSMEHRYFGNSLPVKINYDDVHTWDYLTTEQAANDAHAVVTAFKKILSGKWLSTGASKSGMTTEMYAYYFPGDVDLYVPYVAPFCISRHDARMVKFIYEEAGDLQYGESRARELRNEVLQFQLKLIEYRDVLAPQIYQEGIEAGITFNSYTNADNLYDMLILDCGIGFWQYYQTYRSLERTLALPETTPEEIANKQASCASYLKSIVSVYDCDPHSALFPYYIQAYQELGNYKYDFQYLRNAMTGDMTLSVTEEEEDDLCWNMMFNESMLELEQKDLMYENINNMLATTDLQFVILYGSSDPWYAVRPDDVTRDNINIYVNKNNPHTTSISNFDADETKEILDKIKSILE